jgi:biofilm PGA synthesis N-glycosyltransferase PgaC
MLVFILVIAFVLLCVYAVLFLLPVKRKNSNIRNQETTQSSSERRKISVIIPFRNEELHLPIIIQDLMNQNTVAINWEVLLVNDHSSDRSLEVLASFQLPAYFKMIHSKGQGKKYAVLQGAEHATGEILLFSDADCRLPKNWVKASLSAFSDDDILIIQPVIMRKTSSFLSRFQRMESLALLSINAHRADQGKAPPLISGANYGVSKKRFFELRPYSANINQLSGDDMYLLQAFQANYPGEIRLNYAKEVLITTEPAPTLHHLFKQKVRWASKMKGFKGGNAVFLGLIVMALLFSFLALLVIALITRNSYAWIAWIVLILMKTTIDYLIIQRMAHKFKLFYSATQVLLFQPLYMVYVPVISILSFIYKPKWKGRRT